MSDILFSVVIPTYNRARFIGKAIQSVLDQLETSYEVIVVDDGSTDNTSEVVVAMNQSRVRYFHKQNEERGAARNFGVRQARGKYVTFLDSDDYLLPNHLSVARTFIGQNPNVAAFHQGYEFRDAAGNTLKKVVQTRSINHTLLSGNPMGCIGVFVERKLLLEIPFDEDRRLSSLEDWELWLRLAARVPILHVAEVTSVMVQHEERSVMSANIPRIVEKVEVFCSAVVGNRANQLAFGRRLHSVEASAWTYAALHVAMAGGRKPAFRCLVRGVRRDYRQLFTKRFLVILLFLAGLKK